MVTLIEAKDFRCLRYIHQPLGPFHVLVGPNGSGKTTFLDIITFLGHLISDGLEAAIHERTRNFRDLIWGREGNGFELAIETAIPEELRSLLTDKNFNTIRYEVSFGLEVSSDELIIKTEKVVLKKNAQESKSEKKNQRDLFPNWEGNPPKTIISPRAKKLSRTIVNKIPGGNDNFHSEVDKISGKGWAPSFRLGPRKSALGNLPEDELNFPVSTWLKKFLNGRIQRLTLNSLLIQKASSPGKMRGFKPDGSNLPWVASNLQKKHPENFKAWITHLQRTLPDLEDIRMVEHADDKHRGLMLCYQGGLEVPSWMASDGTLRFLALTLPPYLTDLASVYLIEEPENGIHPLAIETVYQALSSVRNSQVLLTTHSPVILSMVDTDMVLCFAQAPTGETDIVRGSEHPNLKDWKSETNKEILFAASILG